MKAFISHASEDKAAIARPLARALRERRVDVWFDEYSLRPGDSLRASIDAGLASCDYGIVVLSPSFFAKRWPQSELNGLFSRDLASDRRFLFPVWHNVEASDVRAVSPMLADRVAVNSSRGASEIAELFLAVAITDNRQLRQGGKIVTAFSPTGEVLHLLENRSGMHSCSDEPNTRDAGWRRRQEEHPRWSRGYLRPSRHTSGWRRC